MFALENKCVQAVKAYDTAKSVPTEIIKALCCLHRALWNEYHDLFVCTRSPMASPEIRDIPLKYEFPERTCAYGYSKLIQLLRKHHELSTEHMLSLTHSVYGMLGALYELAPDFEDEWVSLLGDVARNGISIERDEDRAEIWTSIARDWYDKARYSRPTIGAIRYRLGLICNDPLHRLSLHGLSLTDCEPCFRAQETLPMSVFSSHEIVESPLEASFVRMHEVLFAGTECDIPFDIVLDAFIQQLEADLESQTPFLQRVATNFATVNIASMFGYGHIDSPLRTTFWKHYECSVPCLPRTQANPGVSLSHASRATFEALNTFLRVGKANDLTYVHIILAFISQIETLPDDARYILDFVPWKQLAIFFDHQVSFPEKVGREWSHPLPEDLHLRGQLWAQRYFPEGIFPERTESDVVRSEVALAQCRRQRVLWLGAQIAAVRMHHYEHLLLVS